MTDSENLQVIADNSSTLIWLGTVIAAALWWRVGQAAWEIVRYAMRSKSLYVVAFFALGLSGGAVDARNPPWPCFTKNGSVTWLSFNTSWPNGGELHFEYQGNNVWTGTDVPQTGTPHHWQMTTVIQGHATVVTLEDIDCGDGGCTYGPFTVAESYGWGQDSTAWDPVTTVNGLPGCSYICSNPGTAEDGDQFDCPCWDTSGPCGNGGGGGSCALPSGFAQTITFHWTTGELSPDIKYELTYGAIPPGGDCGYFGGAACSNSYRIEPRDDGWHFRGPGPGGIDVDWRLTTSTSVDPTAVDWSQWGMAIDAQGTESDYDGDGVPDSQDDDIDGDGTPNTDDCASCDPTKHDNCPCECGGQPLGGDSSGADGKISGGKPCKQMTYCSFKVCKVDGNGQATDNCVTFQWQGIGGGYASANNADWIWSPSEQCTNWRVHFSDGSEFDVGSYTSDPSESDAWGANGWQVSEQKISCSSDHCCGCCCDQCQSSSQELGTFDATASGALGVDPSGQYTSLKSQFSAKWSTLDLGLSGLEGTKLEKVFSIELPDGQFHQFAFEADADAGGPWGSALAEGRSFIRALATLALSASFFLRVWRALAQVL